ncbi:origin recognition complex subunit 3 [Hetaerina americana]|uniref:origin recognition complex subunit 3 n=1 Tax=Hetaerina americana TaxID=62018 RepID=UPI003A7F5C48
MDATISLSRGCFAFNKRCKKKSLPNWDVSGNLWYQHYEIFKALSLKRQDDFCDSIHGPFFEEVIEFVRKSGECFSKDMAEKVPAAMIHTGLALADCIQIYSTLTSKMRKEVTPYIAVLKGKECPSLKVAVESIVQQFTSVLQTKSRVARKKRKTERIDSDSSECESSGEEDVLVKSLKRSNLNFPSLIDWYSTLVDSKGVRTAHSAEKKALVIFFADVEGCAPSVLQDLIYLSKNYLKKLPLVLMFSITSSPSLLTRYVSEHALSNLSYKFIQSPSTNNILHDLVKEVIISPKSIFLLSGKILNIFMNTFNFLDNSLTGFMRMYQFCLMEHYYANPFMSLCCPLSEIKSAIKDLSVSSLEELRQLPSFRKYVESLPPKDRVPLLLDNVYIKKQLLQLMADLHARMWEFHTGVKVLNILSKSLPGSPFGCELHETYIKASTKNIFSGDFEEALKLLRLLSREEFLKVFSSIQELFEDSMKSCPGSGSIIKGAVDKMKFDLHKLAEKDQENSDSLALPIKGSPHKRVGRVLQDSPTLKYEKNCQSLRVVIEPIKLNGNVLVPSSRSPQEKIVVSPVKGLLASPTKCSPVQMRNGSPSGSPSKRVSGESLVTKSPRKRTPKMPKESLFNGHCNGLKETAKDSLDLSLGKVDRAQLRERLLMLSKQSREVAAKEEAKWDDMKGEVLKNLKEALILSLGNGPRPFITFPLYELLVFENVATVRSHLLPPSPQAALHSILINPKQYLECQCCELPEMSSIIPSLPDVSIAYKLHLECGRMINLYDWLQAFSAIINCDDDDNKEVQVDVNMQARFMQAVAELQYMGFIKATKRKADHVVRLTWGGLT